MYCVKCKKKTNTTNEKLVTTSNNRTMKRGNCSVCGTTKTQFVKSSKGGSILNKMINSLPVEMHLLGHNFTGPGTKLNKRLNADLTPKEWSKPINRIDKAAYHHDICYLKNNDTETRNRVCDKNMLEEMKNIYNPSLRERMERGLVSTLIGTKKRFGWGVRKYGTGYIKKKKFTTLAEELHRPIKRKFKKRRVIVNGIDKIWAADLADLTAFKDYNDGYTFLLLVIDTFSKYGYLILLKNKKGETVADALKDIFEKRKPEKLWTDKGKEFYNKNVKDLVELYSTENEEKSSIAERWVRTIKEKMWKYFTDNNTYKYIDVLPDLVEDYNNTVHSSTKLTPKEASKKKNELTVWRNLYPDRYKKYNITPKFSVGDEVRITKKKKVFEKGYTTRWTEEIFTIKEIRDTNPITYILKDLNDKEIKGTFYEPELQKTEQQIYRIEKVIEKEKGRSFVKWKGYSDEFNSWVDNKDLIDLS